MSAVPACRGRFKTIELPGAPDVVVVVDRGRVVEVVSGRSVVRGVVGATGAEVVGGDVASTLAQCTDGRRRPSGSGAELFTAASTTRRWRADAATVSTTAERLSSHRACATGYHDRHRVVDVHRHHGWSATVVGRSLT
jgi:hypothetical protein